MRLLKALALISLSSFMAFSLPAVANTAKQPSKTQQQADKNLKRFTSSIALRFDGIEVTSQNGQNIVNFKYTLQNTSKKSISDVEWITVYYHNNEAILMQNVPVSLKKLEPKKARSLVFSIPFANLTPKAQQVFSNPNSKISSQFQAKSLTFTDKSKIVVQ